MHAQFFSLLLLANLILNFAFGQEDIARQGSMTYIPDSFAVKAPLKIEYVDVLDSIPGDVVKHFPSLKLTVIHHNKGPYDEAWYLAIEKENHFLFFDALQEDVFADNIYLPAHDSNLVDVNEDGTPELIVRWENYMGHTGWENAIHERFGGYLIWDVTNIVCLLDFESYYEKESWWTIFEEDSTGTLSYEEREIIDSDGEHECDRINLFAKPGNVVLYRALDCELKEYLIPPLNTNHLFEYYLTKNGVLKLK